MNGFVCCNCEHRFTESRALQNNVGGFIEFLCPECRSNDIEDAANLETIQTMKREARAVSDGEEAYRRDMQAAGRGHLVHT